MLCLMLVPGETNGRENMNDINREATGSKTDYLPMAGLRCWIISDDKAGNQVQAKGVADALGLNYEVNTVAPRGIHNLLAPRGGVARSEHFGQPGGQFAPPWPDVAIAVGRRAIPYIRALGKQAGPTTYRIILLDPKTGAGSADLIWVPAHDRRRGPNVITTLTSPHSFTPKRLAALRNAMPDGIAALPRPRVAIILGGRTKAYSYGEEDHARLRRSLAALARSGAGLMITSSRRTHRGLLAAVLAATADADRLVYTGEGANPYADFLGCADAFIVTADSVNMTGEAVATGRPVYIFEPAGGSAKFGRFHEALRAHGATRALPDQLNEIETWSYQPLDSAAEIARQIETRWCRRRAMIPGLTGGTKQGG